MSEERLARIEDKVDRLSEGLGKLTELVTRLIGEVGEIKGRIADAPTARDFGRLEGEISQIGQRILDLNSRLPVAIAYAPPEPRRAGGTG